MTDVRLLTTAGNYAVVQLPGRHYPGIVFQGDSLSSMVSTLKEARAQIPGSSPAAASLDEVIELCDEVMASYVAACQRHGVPLPFVK